MAPAAAAYRHEESKLDCDFTTTGNGTVFAGVAAVGDIEDVKETNDRCGHLSGDEILRGHGVLPIWSSWGTADATGRAFRGVVEEADRQMYASKRSRH